MAVNSKTIGLFFGSFNPIHVGHLNLAHYFAEFGGLDQVWFVITPLNPMKSKQSLLPDIHRAALVEQAIEKYPQLKASRVEFDLPQPNYTTTTLAHLQERYPEHQFALILGEDNLYNFHKWKNYQWILDHFPLYVYPRRVSGLKTKEINLTGQIHRLEAPIFEISATFIRQAIKSGQDIRPMLPESVWTYIDEMNFYK
ncbi:MAG: nicotinate (nicotinamide) nucleotide adenylyltransferase [Flavobacteriaceae bacterium]|nr:nicotinate (nicotinamide) nucleotide adenylyltransferase [Flavobacteriaceae bacterium]MDG1962672.1 nicotinate (nicotinamide) nucleotide adenylyltransferase [Flavobacteriaceae bacterium]